MPRFPARPGIRRWIRDLSGDRDAVRSEVDEEIRIHLALTTEQLMRDGLPEPEARREAERRFGSLERRRAELHRLAARRRRSLAHANWRSGVKTDLLLALRSARRNPTMTLIGAVVLGVGIGASTAVFSVFESVIVRPLPYRDPSRLVVVWQTARAGSGEFASGVFDNARDADEWAARSHSFDAMAQLTWATGPRLYRPANGPPREVIAISTSHNLFDVLGVHAEIGRTFSRADVANGCAVVLSHPFWQTTFAGDPSVVGRPITLGDAPCTVLGVMPPSFEFYPRKTELWSLMTPVTDTVLARHPDHYLVGVFARLRHGVSRLEAQRELREIQATGADQTPFRRAFSPTVFDLREEFTWLAGRNLHTTVILLLAAVALVLVVVCVNIANLSLSRAVAREREFAVRVAIGSGRWRLVRQLLIESAVLAASGCVVALVVAYGGVSYINGGQPMELPPGGVARLDFTTLIALLAMAVFATLAVGIAPALRATRTDTVRALKSSSRGSSGDRRSGRMANVLVVSQVSVSTMLLVAAGVLVHSLERLSNAPVGYDPAKLLTMRVNVPSSDTARVRRAFNDILDRVQATPGIEDAAWTSVVPVQGRGSIESIVVEGQAASARDSIPDVGAQTVSESYFRVMRVPVLAGRGFTHADDRTAVPVAVVNHAFVGRYIRGGVPLGHRIRFGGANEPWLTIIGVVGDERRATVTQEMNWIAPPMVFRPVTQTSAPHSMLLVLRPTLEGARVAEQVQRTVNAASSDAIVTELATMDELFARFLASPRTRAQVVAALALLALTLAVIGLYGLLSQVVLHRTREIGIRVALGAKAEEVIVLVMRRGMLLTAAGVVIGGVLVLPAVRSMGALLYGVTTFDPATLALAALAMIGTAVIASALPAWRAASVDPAVALRSE